MSVVHDFTECLDFSHQNADEPWWEQVYHHAFPNLAAMVDVRADGWAQRAGIDRRLCMSNGTTVTVDEKVRRKDYGDIALERWSDERRRKPGWVQKDLACDYIAYAVVPSTVCYLLPVKSLQVVWRCHGRRWIELAHASSANGYSIVSAHNRGYITQSIAIPPAVLLNALRDHMVIRWDDPDLAA